jgi:hypothetical protein
MQPRVRTGVGEVQRADVLGFVSVFRNGGGSDRIELLVGADDPPTECVGRADSNSNPAPFASAIVRPGEYWKAESERAKATGRAEGSGFECVFTPLS